MDIIRINELEVYAYHGVYADEREKGQFFYVNADLYVDTRKAGMTDDLNYSVNYGTVCEFIADFMKNNTYNLIETAAEQLAQALLLEFKPGSFKPAVKTRCPIVPAAFVDSFKPFDNETKGPVTVHLHILKPLLWDEYKGMTTVKIAETVKQRIQAEMDSILYMVKNIPLLRSNRQDNRESGDENESTDIELWQ